MTITDYIKKHDTGVGGGGGGGGVKYAPKSSMTSFIDYPQRAIPTRRLMTTLITGMYMFDLNWQPILWAIVAPIQIKDVYSSVSYQ